MNLSGKIIPGARGMKERREERREERDLIILRNLLRSNKLTFLYFNQRSRFLFLFGYRNKRHDRFALSFGWGTRKKFCKLGF